MKKPDYVIPPRTETLGHLWIWWIEHHCVIPDGDDAGEAFVPSLDHSVYLANWGRIQPGAKLGDRAAAFVYRVGLWVAAQKVGKSPGVAAETCLEFVGPALYGGRAVEGERYECPFPKCECMHDPYFYIEGEPKGRPWATPRIQLAAVVEDQVENTWGALVPMIDLGPLANVIPKTGEAFIRHPNGNRDSRIEIVTSKADGKLGARISAGKCDETGLWTDSNNMAKFERTLRRGAGGMGGRISHSSNPYDPAENSVLQRQMESKQKDILKHHYPPPAAWNFKLKKDRELIFKWNYASSPWVDLRTVEAESVALMETDPAEAERFFGNRIVAGRGSWLEMAKWEERVAASPVTVKPRTKICLGFDGSDSDDLTGIRAETLDQHQFTPRYGDDRKPTLWDPRDWQQRVPRSEVMAAFREVATEFEIVRAYLDPPFWTTEIDLLAAEFGEKVFLKWFTNRPSQMHSALERFRTDVYNADTEFTHDGDEVVATHLRNAVIRAGTVDPVTKIRKYTIGKPEQHQKIDYAMSSVLAHEAVMDAIASGARNQADDTNYVYY